MTQVCRFHDGGCAIHRIPFRANHFASAWFDAMGNMLDAEWRRIDGRTTYHVTRHGPAWQAIIETVRPVLQALADEDARAILARDAEVTRQMAESHANNLRLLADLKVAANAPAYVDPDGNPHY